MPIGRHSSNKVEQLGKSGCSRMRLRVHTYLNYDEEFVAKAADDSDYSTYRKIFYVRILSNRTAIRHRWVSREY